MPLEGGYGQFPRFDTVVARDASPGEEARAVLVVCAASRSSSDALELLEACDLLDALAAFRAARRELRERAGERDDVSGTAS